MTAVANSELWSIYDARRVKAPELRGMDSIVNGVVQNAATAPEGVRLVHYHESKVDAESTMKM